MWTLILLVYAGIFADGDSVAITYVPNFSNQQMCVAAGKSSEGMVSGTKKELEFVCVKNQ
jgi:hypothetical protein